MIGVEQRRQRVWHLPTDPPSIHGEAKHDRWGEDATRYIDMARQTRVRTKIVRFALDQQRRPLCIIHEIPCRGQIENGGGTENQQEILDMNMPPDQHKGTKTTPMQPFPSNSWGK